MKKYLLDIGTRDHTASLGLLVLRACVGLMLLLGHGIGKIQHFTEYKDHFPVPRIFPLNYMSPPVSLILAAFAEVGAAGLLIVGLATRPAAFIIAFTMVIAAFQVHQGAPWFMAPGVAAAKEPALLYLIPMLCILITGAGKYSIDSKFMPGRRAHIWS